MSKTLPTWAFPRSRSALWGATLPYRAARLILSKPTLFLWSLFPVALTLTFYGFVIRTLQQMALRFLDQRFEAWGWNMSDWKAWGLSFLIQILLLLVSAFTFSAVSSVIASPFNDFLAEKTEAWATPPLPAVARVGWGAKAKLILIDLVKTVAAGVATICAILLSWIPVVNVAAFGLAFLLVTFQYISYPQTRRGLGLGEGLRFLFRHFFACLGFGAVLTMLFAIPIVSSLCLPLAVVGGTLLVARAQSAPGNFPLK